MEQRATVERRRTLRERYETLTAREREVFTRRFRR